MRVSVWGSTGAAERQVSRTIGVIPGQISESGAARLAEAEGIDPEVVEVAGPPEMPPLLERGIVDERSPVTEPFSTDGGYVP